MRHITASYHILHLSQRNNSWNNAHRQNSPLIKTKALTLDDLCVTYLSAERKIPDTAMQRKAARERRVKERVIKCRVSICVMRAEKLDWAVWINETVLSVMFHQSQWGRHLSMRYFCLRRRTLTILSFLWAGRMEGEKKKKGRSEWRWWPAKLSLEPS